MSITVLFLIVTEGIVTTVLYNNKNKIHIPVHFEAHLHSCNMIYKNKNVHRDVNFILIIINYCNDAFSNNEE